LARRVLVQVLSELKSSHRGRLAIIATILRSTMIGARKTSIMYKCNLSFKQLEFYLGFLLRKGHLKMSTKSRGNNSRFFETTEKGFDFLQAYRNLEEVMSK